MFGFLSILTACKPDYEKRLADLDREMTVLSQQVDSLRQQKMTTAAGTADSTKEKQFKEKFAQYKAKANQFIEASEQYAATVKASNPDKYAEVIIRAAGLAKSVESPSKSIQLYSSISENMNPHPKAPMALFMTGFIYENDLNDLPKAKQTYETFLQRYPNDPDFADDAQSALKMLGKSPEEIIKEFEAQQRIKDSLDKKNQ